jgi:hypothetical protein
MGWTVAESVGEVAFQAGKRHMGVEGVKKSRGVYDMKDLRDLGGVGGSFDHVACPLGSS